MTNDAILLDDVAKVYGHGPTAVTALRGVSLRIAAGEFVSIVGASGSGKSTMLHVLAGLETPTCGRVFIGGADLAHLSDDARSDLRLHGIGIVFQSFNLFPTFTAEENVAWPLEFAGAPWRVARERARALLDAVGIDPRGAGRRPAALSGGEQQRVAIARALVVEPTLLLADEPTGNLDSRTGDDILALLCDLNRTRHLTVVLVTHCARAAARAERTIELEDGLVVERPATFVRVVPPVGVPSLRLVRGAAAWQ
jgi:putative ABC transport system ATP-binding protein